MSNPHRWWRSQSGQSTVELALVVPLLMVFVLVVLQIVGVLRDAVALTAAARSAARRAMVDPAPATVRSAATGETRLSADRLSVVVTGGATPGSHLTVVVRYRAPTDVPVVGAFIGDVDLSERYVVLRE